MNYRTIAVHLDAGPRCPARLALAVRLAREHDARLVGVVATGLPDVVVRLNSAVPDSLELIALDAALLRRRAEALAASFAHGYGGALETVVRVDDPLDATVEVARWSDLVVVGQSEPGCRVENVADDFAQQIMLHAGVPTLVVPHGGTPAGPFRSILVAWKDSRECARALRDALPLLRRAERIAVVEVADAAEGGADDGRDAARRWFADHELAIEASRETGEAEAGERLLAHAGAWAADLVVMGGYGHSRAREWLLGGVTRHVLAHATVPVLFSH